MPRLHQNNVPIFSFLSLSLSHTHTHTRALSRTDLNKSSRIKANQENSRRWKFRGSTSIALRSWRTTVVFDATRQCPCRTRNSTWSPPGCRGCPRRLNRGDRRPQVGSTVADAGTTASDHHRERDRRCRPPWDPRAAICSGSSALPSPPGPVSTAEK